MGSCFFAFECPVEKYMSTVRYNSRLKTAFHAKAIENLLLLDIIKMEECGSTFYYDIS